MVKLRRYSNSLSFMAHDDNCYVDIRCAIFGSAHPRKHDMASQARNSPVQTRAECLAGGFLEVAHAHTCDGNQTQVTLRRWRWSPVGTKDISWHCGMYARRTCHKRVRALSAPATFGRETHRNHCADTRASHVYPCGCTRARAHVVRLHGQPRDGVLVRASRLGAGRAPACHPRRCAPRRRRVKGCNDG